MRTAQNMTWGWQDLQTLMDGSEIQPEPQKGHLGTSPLSHFLLHRLFWSSLRDPWNCSITAQLGGFREGTESPPVPAHPGTSGGSTAAGPKLTGKSGAPQIDFKKPTGKSKESFLFRVDRILNPVPWRIRNARIPALEKPCSAPLKIKSGSCSWSSSHSHKVTDLDRK